MSREVSRAIHGICRTASLIHVQTDEKLCLQKNIQFKIRTLYSNQLHRLFVAGKDAKGSLVVSFEQSSSPAVKTYLNVMAFTVTK
eukprot:scaffold61952_cov19-Prasinocladus_malaysianus.AAC.1